MLGARITSARVQNLHMPTKLARAGNVCLILQAQLQPHLGEAVKSQTLSQEYERARYRNKFELGGEPGKLILDRGYRL